jgi:thiamine biosynthesis lipoprotein
MANGFYQVTQKPNTFSDKIFLIIVILLLLCCGIRKDLVRSPHYIEGKTMGTTYHITYFDKRKKDFKPSIDSLLKIVNQSINNYDPLSEVSIFNKATHSFLFKLPYFYPPLKVAKEVYKSSGGAFDPTVMPLVNAWGFGQQQEINLNKTKIDSLLAIVGFNKISFTSDSIYKADPRIQVDFGGIGQGYGADVITNFLQAKGIKNMLVELGGEGMAVGINLEKQTEWEIGILDPTSDYAHQSIKASVKIKDRSFTTSGSYANYREIDGVKYSHIIDPFTGYPSDHRLLSVTVFAKDATTADAWDTGLMVLGDKKAIHLIEQHPELDAFFIYSDDAGNLLTYATKGIKSYIKIIH